MTIIQCQVIYKVQITSSHNNVKCVNMQTMFDLLGQAVQLTRKIYNESDQPWVRYGWCWYIYMDTYVGILSRRLNKVQYKLK